MFLSIEQIGEALHHLELMHTFYGTTFLVFKSHNIPVGRTVEFPLINKDREFLEQYYKPHPQSEHFYRVSRTSAAESQHWLSPKFPGGGLQKIRTQDPLRQAFLHPKKSNLWGWQSNYVAVLKGYLYNRLPIPAFHLAVWLYREREWADETTGSDIVWTFLTEFNFTQDEIDALFDIHAPAEVKFDDKKVSWRQLRTLIDQLPPDAPKEEGGTLACIELKGVGPAPSIQFEPAARINLITGDNGLGKTFLLECVWWVLTGLWAGLPAHPYTQEAEISYQISGEYSKSKKRTIKYDWDIRSWPQLPDHDALPGLLVYARADNSFAVWDPARRQSSIQTENLPEELVFSPVEVWDGKRVFSGGRSRFISNGLIADWVLWQNNTKRSEFDIFKQVLARLSPVEMGPLSPGEPVRLLDDSRDMPTLRLPYGDVPVVHAAAGMRRILALAYLIVWAWSEHQTQAGLAHKSPQRQMIVLVDEVEAHLHPRWQRLIVPALLDAQEDLDPELQIQFLITTHSPLVTASIEPLFDSTVDKLFLLDLVKPGLFQSEVKLEELPFIRQGTGDAWLTSDAFQLGQARSIEAENAIEAAKALQLEDNPSAEAIRHVTNQLVKYLAENDAFWPRWIWFAEQYGVEL